jgi:predicted AAA+ superfamily ATPase
MSRRGYELFPPGMSDGGLGSFLEKVGAATPVREPSGNRPQTIAETNSDWARTLAAAACWAQTGQSYFPVSNVVKSVPPGAYKCMVSDQGPYLEKMTINIDHLLTLPDSATEILLSEFSQFWELKQQFHARGFTFKRGMLMWGPPGSGKTSAVWQMTQRLVKDLEGAVLFVDNPQNVIWCINVLRRIEPSRPIITVMEDLDAIIHQHGEHALLALLDGEFQTDNVVHIATTNYPQFLDRRFVDRPSRFDTIMEIGMPSKAARRVYFKSKEPTLTDNDLERWVELTDGYSVAHLREVIIAIKCFGQKERDVFDRLDAMRDAIKVNEYGEARGKVGFHVESHPMKKAYR